jgi:hypothetical protein
MAPEHPPVLVVFDAKIINGALKGTLQYIEPEEGGRELRVRWGVENQPEGFVAVGEGVAYVYAEDTKARIIPISEDASPDHLGDSRYRWIEGLQFGVERLMFTLILPQGYTLTNPEPVPTGTKNFHERLALYWILEGTHRRTQVEWTIEEFDGDLGSEIVRINRASPADKPSDSGPISLIS